MAGHLYMDGAWVSQGIISQVNEEQTADPTSAAAAGAVRQFVAGQLGKTISLPDPTNSGDLIPKTYQYIQRHENSIADLVPGTLMYWTLPCHGTFEVIEGDNQEVGTPALLIPAGIFLGDDAAAVGAQGVQPGNFGFIQIGGCVDALYLDGVGGAGAGEEVMDGAFAGTSRGLATRATPSAPRIGVALETVAPEGDDATGSVLLDLVSLTVSQ